MQNLEKAAQFFIEDIKDINFQAYRESQSLMVHVIFHAQGKRSHLYLISD